MHEILIEIKEVLSWPLSFPFNPQQRIYLPYLLAAFLIAIHVYLFTDPEGKRFRIIKMLKYCFPKAVYLHKSALVDYGYFFIHNMFFFLLLQPLWVISVGSSILIQRMLISVLGPPIEPVLSGMPLMISYTVVGILAMDLGLYMAHYFQHKIPALWQFHKVHHSAEVLTPITVYRMHPVDDLLSVSLAGLMTGCATGLFSFLARDHVYPLMILGVNAGVFIYYMVGYNLRHSHIWLSYGPVLSRILISPAQHQIHHSKARKHYDKNIGFIFAFWDVIMKTVYVPKGKEDIEFGLANDEEKEFSNILRLYILPFKKCFDLFNPKKAQK